MALDDPAAHQRAVGGPDLLTDHRIKGLPGVCSTIRIYRAITASTVAPVILACFTAQRRGARDDGEPSTPTTILGVPSAIHADIGIRSLRVPVRHARQHGLT
jgi:hypothetical protein